MRRRTMLGLAAATVAAVGAPATVRAAPRPWREEYVSLGGGAHPVHVYRVGAPTARQVLVLVAGQFGAAGGYRILARGLARRLPGTQVWAVDRRQADLADLSVLRGGDLDRSTDRYLAGRYRSWTAGTAPFAADWGLATTLADVRRVVCAARADGRRVVLGGHSWGATTALLYAGWDFAGRPGHRDLTGLVLLDGGVHDAFAGEGDVYRVTPAQARDGLVAIAAGEVFDPSLTMGRTETYAVLALLAGRYARTAPSAPSTLAARLPAPLRPAGPVDNLGLVEHLYASHPLVPDLAIGPAYTSVAAAAEVLAGAGPTAFEWYWPQRLTLDLSAADPFSRTATTDVLGLRPWHGASIDVPLYCFQTGLTCGSVTAAARWVTAHSRIPTATYAGDEAMTHLDALWADPRRSPVVDTVVPFLRRLDER
ncbi:hypothetical protein [Actinocatenispora rupis]|uniref:Alpha/beta hydrolase family protein n=1 Tax=Actinocatenispora rupis TaxID=519421 RepID=A0A8J3NDR4_9ACTN|nr:hypothetical protein [Actinocatenispora rupis]GID15574.1 hypothetical protein Aru02nite_64630 [Actinocatenispora rupis]